MESKTKNNTDTTLSRLPLHLTENAKIVLKNRYLKRDEQGQTSETPEELFDRVARSVAAVEKKFDGCRLSCPRHCYHGQCPLRHDISTPATDEPSLSVATTVKPPPLGGGSTTNRVALPSEQSELGGGLIGRVGPWSTRSVVILSAAKNLLTCEGKQ